MITNNLTDEEAARLAILIEKAGEIVQIGCKILRHGYERTNNGKLPHPNRWMLELELADLLAMFYRMSAEGDLKGFDR